MNLLTIYIYCSSQFWYCRQIQQTTELCKWISMTKQS